MILNSLDTALFLKLSADATLTGLLAAGADGVFAWRAPQEANTPYVVFNAQSPSIPSYTFGGVAWEETLYQVKAVTLGHSAAAAGTIAARIDVLLADGTLTVGAHSLRYMRREQDVDFPEEAPGGQQYRHRGALYRIRLDPD